jgi:hypothetical protein
VPVLVELVLLLVELEDEDDWLPKLIVTVRVLL